MYPSLLAALALSVGAPAVKEKEKPTIVGEWANEQYTIGGMPPQPAPTGRDLRRWVFRADGSRSILGVDGKEVAGGRYAADPAAGTLDFESASDASVDKYLCRYKLDGDTLILNVGWPKADRPAGLESPPDSKCTLYVMKRVKPKD
jgi:hypothetical protein